jgi:hypothetical protein
MYSRDVFFKEFGGKSEPEEDVQIENNTDTVQFELRNKEDDSDESTESAEEVEQLTLVVRRSERIKKRVERYILPDFRSTFVLTAIDDEPKLVGETIETIEGKLWKDAIVEGMESLYKNETCDLVKLPSGRNIVGSKWVFKKKMNPAGQVEGVEFGEIFSHVAKLTSIRVIMSLATTFNMEIEQIDLKTMFLHGDLEEEIYMKQPKGVVVKGNQELVCKLKISLYGLKQSPRMWYRNFNTYILSLGLVRSKANHCIYSKEEGGRFI